MFLNAHPLGTSLLYRVRNKDKGAVMICLCGSENISFSLTRGDKTRNRMFRFCEGFDIRIRKRIILGPVHMERAGSVKWAGSPDRAVSLENIPDVISDSPPMLKCPTCEKSFLNQ